MAQNQQLAAPQVPQVPQQQQFPMGTFYPPPLPLPAQIQTVPIEQVDNIKLDIAKPPTASKVIKERMLRHDTINEAIFQPIPQFLTTKRL